MSKIDELMYRVGVANRKAEEILKKRRNLLKNTTADSPSALIKAAVTTYYEDFNTSTHLQIPPSLLTVGYLGEQLIFHGHDKLANEYIDVAHKLLSVDASIKRTNITEKKIIDLFVEFDKLYNEYLHVYSKALKVLAASNEKYPYQTGIQ